MGFDVEYIADIQKFPNPLYTRYKQNYKLGYRLQVTATIQDFEINVSELFPIPNIYELLGIVVGTSHFTDLDCWSLYADDTILFHQIYTKDAVDTKTLQPVKKFNPEENILKFVYHNLSGIDKSVWIDFSCSCKTAIHT